MRVGLAADHAGFELKQQVAERLRGGGYEVVDFGASQFLPEDDYPDFVGPLAEAVAERQVDRGVAVCGSGVGASVVANKVRGVRAGLCHDTYSAHQGVEHDDMNVLVLGSRVLGPALAHEIVRTFLEARFTAEERHARRLRKIQAWEAIGTGPNPTRSGMKGPTT